MKRGQYSEEKIVKILKEAVEVGNATEICRKYGISHSTFTRWKDKYSGLEVSDVVKLKQLEAENARLHRIVSKQALEIEGLKEVVSKKW
jgi:putative transposase